MRTGRTSLLTSLYCTGLLVALGPFSAHAEEAPDVEKRTAVSPAPQAAPPALTSAVRDDLTIIANQLDQSLRANTTAIATQLNKKLDANTAKTEAKAESNQKKVDAKLNAFASTLSALDGVKFGFSIGPRYAWGDGVKDGIRSASIDPGTENLRIATRDATDMVASALAVAFPFETTPTATCNDTASIAKAEAIDEELSKVKDQRNLTALEKTKVRVAGNEAMRGALKSCVASQQFNIWDSANFGIAVNINFASIGKGGGFNSFNSSIEGGLGIGYRIHPSFAFFATVERLVFREEQEGIVADSPVLAEPTGDTENASATNLKTISVNDDRFFKDEDATAISLKFVFLLDG